MGGLQPGVPHGTSAYREGFPSLACVVFAAITPTVQRKENGVLECSCLLPLAVGIPDRHVLCVLATEQRSLFDPALFNDRWRIVKAASPHGITHFGGGFGDDMEEVSPSSLLLGRAVTPCAPPQAQEMPPALAVAEHASLSAAPLVPASATTLPRQAADSSTSRYNKLLEVLKRLCRTAQDCEGCGHGNGNCGKGDRHTSR